MTSKTAALVHPGIRGRRALDSGFLQGAWSFGLVEPYGLTVSQRTDDNQVRFVFVGAVASSKLSVIFSRPIISV
jgi:hypothetical protein